MLATGSVLDEYRIDGVLGRGGMSIVYEATDLALDRHVALKVISAAIDDDPEFRERFRREGIQQAKLDHPNIVTVYRAAEAEGQLFIAMRLVRGKNLKELALAGELTTERTIRILNQIAGALDFAHASGVIHRDVKPQNILVDESDSAFLADFGLVKGRGDRTLTKIGRNLGSVDYMSPEQIMDGAANATARSDIYAFAAVLYECLSGSVPFPRETEGAVVVAHVQDPLPPASSHRPELSAAVDALLADGMAKRPEDRPESATDLIDAARAALATAPRTQSDGQKTVRGETVVDLPVARPAPPKIEAQRPILSERISATWRRVAGQRSSASLKLAPRSRVALASGAAIVAAAVALGAIVGISTRSTTKPAATNTQTRGGFTVTYPAGWTPAPNTRLNALPIRASLTLRTQVGGGRFALALIAAPSAGLLPQTLERGIRGLTQAVAVRVGTLSAYRYRRASATRLPADFRLYAFPTSRGTAVAYCYGAASGSACEEIVQTASAVGAKALPLGPSPLLARELTRILASLDEARRTDRKLLANAAAPSSQARAATQLGSGYERALQQLRRDAVGPIDKATTAQLGDALSSTAAALARSARAARSGDGNAFTAGLQAATTAERRLTVAIGALSRLGYRVRS